jgi:hypothetical protein
MCPAPSRCTRDLGFQALWDVAQTNVDVWEQQQVFDQPAPRQMEKLTDVVGAVHGRSDPGHRARQPPMQPTPGDTATFWLFRGLDGYYRDAMGW